MESVFEIQNLFGSSTHLAALAPKASDSDRHKNPSQLTLLKNDIITGTDYEPRDPHVAIANYVRC